MRLAIKIFIILTTFLAILLTGSYFYLRVRGKDLLVSSFNKQFHREIDFKEIHFSFPSTVRFRDLVIKGTGEAREVSLSLNLMGLFFQQVRISNVRTTGG